MSKKELKALCDFAIMNINDFFHQNTHFCGK